ncbi:MAG TPA: hypothetical protein VFS67_09120 [Polyangiaceae bacterium]|nr:hypothetical protein [Polyangiaceae bacterium]
MNSDHGTTVILGGTGKTGRRIAHRLRARGLPVRSASRSGAPRFDWNDPTTWAPILEGAHSLYIAYPPDLAAPEAQAHIQAMAEQAVTKGIRKIVLLSGRGEPQCYPAERSVRESGAAFTILRCAWFAQNFSEGQLLPAVLDGRVAFPAGDVAEPFVDLDDVADVAVDALTRPIHNGKLYELSGPQLLTFAEAVGEVGKALGRSIDYLPISFTEYAQSLSQFVPAEEVAFLTQLFEFVLDGHNAYLSDGVQQALGRKPRAFGEFARDAAAAGAWQS